MTLREIGLTDSICVIEKKSLHIARATSFMNSMPFAKKINPVGFLHSTRIAAARLNHLVEPISFSAVAIILSWSTITGLKL